MKNKSHKCPQNQFTPYGSCFALFHRVQADANCPAVGIQTLNSGELENGLREVPQTLSREVRAGNVLHEGCQVDARVLLGRTVGC